MLCVAGGTLAEQGSYRMFRDLGHNSLSGTILTEMGDLFPREMGSVTYMYNAPCARRAARARPAPSHALRPNSPVCSCSFPYAYAVLFTCAAPEFFSLYLCCMHGMWRA